MKLSNIPKSSNLNKYLRNDFDYDRLCTLNNNYNDKIKSLNLQCELYPDIDIHDSLNSQEDEKNDFFSSKYKELRTSKDFNKIKESKVYNIDSNNTDYHSQSVLNTDFISNMNSTSGYRIFTIKDIKNDCKSKFYRNNSPKKNDHIGICFRKSLKNLKNRGKDKDAKFGNSKLMHDSGNSNSKLEIIKLFPNEMFKEVLSLLNTYDKEINKKKTNEIDKNIKIIPNKNMQSDKYNSDNITIQNEDIPINLEDLSKSIKKLGYKKENLSINSKFDKNRLESLYKTINYDQIKKNQNKLDDSNEIDNAVIKPMEKSKSAIKNKTTSNKSKYFESKINMDLIKRMDIPYKDINKKILKGKVLNLIKKSCIIDVEKVSLETRKIENQRLKAYKSKLKNNFSSINKSDKVNIYTNKYPELIHNNIYTYGFEDKFTTPGELITENFNDEEVEIIRCEKKFFQLNKKKFSEVGILKNLSLQEKIEEEELFSNKSKNKQEKSVTKDPFNKMRTEILKKIKPFKFNFKDNFVENKVVENKKSNFDGYSYINTIKYNFDHIYDVENTDNIRTYYDTEENFLDQKESNLVEILKKSKNIKKAFSKKL